MASISPVESMDEGQRGKMQAGFPQVEASTPEIVPEVG